MDNYGRMDAFDRWMNRPVYKVQCRTFKKALELLNMKVPEFSAGQGLATRGHHLINEFRVLPAYRTPEGRLLRDMVALAVKMDRFNARHGKS